MRGERRESCLREAVEWGMPVAMCGSSSSNNRRSNSAAGRPEWVGSARWRPAVYGKRNTNDGFATMSSKRRWTQPDPLRPVDPRVTTMAAVKAPTAVRRLATVHSKRSDRLGMATLPDRYFVMRVGGGFKALRPGLRQEPISQMPVVAVHSTRAVQEEQGRSFW